MKLFRKLWSDESGQGMVEYGLIVALIVIAIIVVLTTMGDKIKALFNKAGTSVNDAAATE
jgi:pilus assembly protein Flp/PilA